MRILQELDFAEERVLEGQSAPSGLVRVTVSPAFGRMFVVPRLLDFRNRFPDVVVEMDVSARHVDLIEEGIDVAVRIGRLSDSALIARHIGDMRMMTLASAGYLARHGTPQTLEELRTHRRIGYVYQGNIVEWEFEREGRHIAVDGGGAFRTNDAEHVRAAVLAGLGIGHHASWLFTDVLASGEVSQVLEPYAPPPLPIAAVTAAGRRMPSRVRHFIDFLAAICADEPELKIEGS
ncbi:MAG: hypothetical protein B7Z40_23300 [Bosea sp. 12-68-7]|nr:MAG: hypothetical protein B7Z40_23300 [Bosea sp. 12-68-7]